MFPAVIYPRCMSAWSRWSTFVPWSSQYSVSGGHHGAALLVYVLGVLLLKCLS